MAVFIHQYLYSVKVKCLDAFDGFSKTRVDWSIPFIKKQCKIQIGDGNDGPIAKY